MNKVVCLAHDIEPVLRGFEQDSESQQRRLLAFGIFLESVVFLPLASPITETLLIKRKPYVSRTGSGSRGEFPEHFWGRRGTLR